MNSPSRTPAWIVLSALGSPGAARYEFRSWQKAVVAIATKWYLHAATTTDTGTLPGAGISLSATTPTKIASGVNRAMDATIGTAQASIALTTNGVTTAQPSMIGRWLSAPLATQTISSTWSITMHIGASEASTNSVFQIDYLLGVWRPGGGSSVGLVADIGGGSYNTTALETDISTGFFALTSSVNCLNGDVLVLEIWRSSALQTMATAYANTIFFDGTTEASATTNAAYINFTNTIAMYSAPTPAPDVTVARTRT